MNNRRLAATVAAATVLLTSCGLGDSGKTGPNIDAQSDELAGATLVVGSKDFDESILLGQMTKYLLQDAGAHVTEKMNIASGITRGALISRDIDIYWDYTGTGWIADLGHTQPITDPAKQYEAVRDEDLSKHGLVWAEPAPMNNAYAIAVKSSFAKEHNLATISDAKRLIAEDPDAGTLCTENEFVARDDGLPGLQDAYGFSFAKVSKMSTGLVYTELDKGACNFGVVYATDGRIAALHLTVLQDDKHFFPIYNAAAVLRTETNDKYPYIRETMSKLAPLLTDDVMRKLNARVSADGEPAADVALDFLQSQNLIEKD